MGEKMEVAVYKELDDVKGELELLKEEYRKKTELHQSLRRAHDEKLIKLQEAKLQFEKQYVVLGAKEAELFETEQVCEELKLKLSEKDSALRQLTCANEKLHTCYEEKVKSLEGVNKELGSALDEVVIQKKDLEQKLNAKNDENAGLKALVAAAERKCSDVERNAHVSKELSYKDEVITKLEDESRDFKEQLKWKNESFKHLEEAYEILRDKFQSSKLEWERDKSMLVDKISSLQSISDSQTRISNSLQTKLKMCNQALAHEESRRRLIEVQLLESQALFENIYAKCQDEQANINKLTTQRDEEIASLRDLLATKDILFKEMEFKILDLKQQKEELHASLKELQEAGIQSADSGTSVIKLQSKLRSLEKVHGSCSLSLEVKETEWNSQLGKLKAEIKEYLSNLKKKEIQINGLHKELEMCKFSLQILNEEMAVVVMILKSEFSEAYSKLLVEMENRGQKESSTTAQKSELNNLMAQEQFFTLNKELDVQKDMLKETQRIQVQLEEEVSQLNQFKAELAERTLERDLTDAEFQKWKNAADILKSSLEAIQEVHKQDKEMLKFHRQTEQALKQEINNLLTVVEEHERSIDALRQHVASFEATTAAKDDALNDLKLKKEGYIEAVQQRDSIIDNLQNEICLLELEFMHKEMEGAFFAQFDAERRNALEKKRFEEASKDKDNIIENLQKNGYLLEQELTNSVTSSIQEVVEKQIVQDALAEALTKSKSEIQMKQNTIQQVERELIDLQGKLVSHSNSLIHSKEEKEQLVALLAVKDKDVAILRNRLHDEQTTLKGIIEELESRNEYLNEKLAWLIMDRKKIIAEQEEASSQHYDICCQDDKLLGALRHMIGAENELQSSHEISNQDVKDAAVLPSLIEAKVQVSTDERLPFQEINL